MRKTCLLAAATYLLAAAPLQASPIAITDVTRYYINDFPQYASTADGLTMGRVSGDPVRVLGSYLAASDTPFTDFTFAIEPSLMPGADVWSTVTLCLDGAWDISNPIWTVFPTCSSGITTAVGLTWRASLTYDAGRYDVAFSGTTTGALSFAPVQTVGVLTHVQSTQVENAVEVYWNQLRADGVPPPFYGPGWVSAAQSFGTAPTGQSPQQDEAVPIPEPATTALLLVGLGIAAVRRRRGTI